MAKGCPSPSVARTGSVCSSVDSPRGRGVSRKQEWRLSCCCFGLVRAQGSSGKECSKRAATQVTPVLLLGCPRGEGGLYFWPLLQTDAASLIAWIILGAEALRCCWRFMFARLASAKSGKGKHWANIDWQFSVHTVLAGELLRTYRLWIPAAAHLGDDYWGSS